MKKRVCKKKLSRLVGSTASLAVGATALTILFLRNPETILPQALFFPIIMILFGGIIMFMAGVCGFLQHFGLLDKMLDWVLDFMTDENFH